MKKSTLAVDIGGTKFSLATFEGSELTRMETRSTDRDGGPARMFSQMEEIWQTWKSQGAGADRCGIGFGGPVNFTTQQVTLSTHVRGWAGYPLVHNLEQLAQCRAVVDNDANVGALGEATYGAGRGCDSLLYMTLSTGIGGGIVWESKVYRGADCYAGELGHMTLEPNGPECLCGSHGCFERMCCGLWLERDFGRPARELLSDPEFVARYVVLLARGLKAAIMILNPARIVIGGGMSKAGEQLFSPLRQELDRQMTSWSRARRDVVAAELADQSVLYGALTLAEQYL